MNEDYVECNRYQRTRLYRQLPVVNFLCSKFRQINDCDDLTHAQYVGKETRVLIMNGKQLIKREICEEYKQFQSDEQTNSLVCFANIILPSVAYPAG